MFVRRTGCHGLVFVFVWLQTHCIALHVFPDGEPAATKQELLDTLSNVRYMDEPTRRAIVNLTTPTVSKGQCGHRIRNASYGGGSWYVWCEDLMKKLIARNATIGLSYGIGNSDPWSAFLGNNYRIPTELYDCFATAKNGNTLKQYAMPYVRHDICLGGTAHTDEKGHEWQTIDMHLLGRPPLSTLTKIDIEGSEWEILPAFLRSPSSINVVALIDMEFHFCDQKLNFSAIALVFRKLLDNFVVTGRYPSDNRDRILTFPGTYDKRDHCGGMPGIIAVSYVNKRLLLDEIESLNDPEGFGYVEGPEDAWGVNVKLPSHAEDPGDVWDVDNAEGVNDVESSENTKNSSYVEGPNDDEGFDIHDPAFGIW